MKKLLQIPKVFFGILMVLLLGCTTLHAQSVQITSPNGGESWLGGSSRAITWTYSNVDNISIEFSKDNGLTWTMLTNSIPASTLSYAWTAPAVGSNLCKIRIKSLTQNSQDESNATFTIPEPTVALSYPMGGESFGAGTGQYIEWSTVGVTTVMVQYSTDNASTWNDIGSFPAANNYCNWVAPTTSSTQTKIRVYNIESPINQATSPTSFSITTQPTAAAEKYYGGSNDGYKMASSLSNTLAVLAPNGGESYYPNNTVNISWSFRNIDTVKIEYSVNNGSTWNVIAPSVVADLQTYPWTIPNSPSTQCLIKVSDLGIALSDVSNATFTINSASVTLTYPNGGESFGEGTGQYIEWTSSSVATVLLEYSIDNGTTWSSIGTAAATNNYANWVAPAGANSQCLIRVSDSTTPSVSDTSNATFTTTTVPIADVAKYRGGTNDGYSMVNNLQPNITISSPNGGESWAAYSTRTITWSYTNVDNVSIEFSIDNGTTWSTLVASIPASQLSYSWTVPGTPSNFCIFRVKDVVSAVFDTNDTVFIIPNDLSVQIKYPNGGETFGVGTGQYIEWDYNNIQTLKLEYSIDNGTNWLVIGTVNAADKYANWVAPATISNQILLRASDVNNLIYADISDSVFTTNQVPLIASEKYFGGSNDGYSMFSTIVVPSTIIPPTISGFSPTTICSSESGTFTITGTGLDKVTSVLFSGGTGINLLGTITSQSPTNLIVTTPVNIVDGFFRLLSSEGTVDSASILSVLPNSSPTFSAVAPICSGATLTSLPTTSNNGITGTWLPAIDNTATTNYTFTPTASLCATTATMTIVVNPNVTPTFTQISPVCSGATITALPTTSNNGITGTWLPAVNSNITTTYTFTPTAGQCANTTTQTITITAPKVTSPISFVAPVAALTSVTIGTQVWTNKNLDVTTYRDGTTIPQVTDPAAWANLTTGAWCYYNNDVANGAIYGKLYNWYAVAGIHDNDPNTPNKILAPLGWHVPSDEEWTILIDYLDPNANGGANYPNVAGGKMKATTLWSAPNTAASNSSGFTGLPGGYRHVSGLFDVIGRYCFWWSSSKENGTPYAWYRALFNTIGVVGRGSLSLGDGYSVRCLRD